MNLKNQLKTYLEYRGLSASQLSRKSEVKKQNISSWLTGTPPRDFEQVKRVAEALGTTMDWLCFGKGIDTAKEQEKTLDSILGGEWITGKLEFKVRLIKED